MAFGSSQWIYDAASDTGEYDIPNSLRFNDDDSAYLSWTPGSAGNRKTWTWSGWVKRGNLAGGGLHLMRTSSPEDAIRFDASNEHLHVYMGGTSSANLRTDMLFRDVSAWYHIVVAVDTTQATSSKRCKTFDY